MDKKMFDALIVLAGVSCNKNKIGGWGFSVYEIKDSSYYKAVDSTKDKQFSDNSFNNYYLSSNGINRKWQKAKRGDDYFTVFNVINLYELSGSTKTPSSIAKSESTGFLSVLKFIEAKKWKNVLIYSDSKYVADRLNVLVKNKEDYLLKRKDGQNISTYDQWVETAEYILKLSADKVSIKWEWVSNNLPIKMADYSKLLAKKGQALAFNKKDYIEEIFPFGKKKVVENKIHGLLTQGRLYFIPNIINVREDGKTYYFCGNHGSDDDRCGKPKSDNTMSVIITKIADPVLELLFKIKRQYDCNDKGNIIRLDNIKTAGVRNEIMTYHKDLMFYDNEKGNLFNYAGRNLVIEQNPPYLFFRLFEKIENLYKKLNNIEGGIIVDETIIIDITEKIFKFSDKGRLKVNDLLISNKAIDVNVPKLNTKVTLSVGVELLPDLGLKRITHLNPKIKLYIEKLSPLLYKYYVHIKTSDAVGLFTTTDSNSIFIKKEKLN